MTGAAPRQEYTRRMHRVLAHIDAHLSQPLPLAELAAVAHLSPFHFHRMFTAWGGETVGEHIRRRRVEVAALRLLTQPRTPVLEIAPGNCARWIRPAVRRPLTINAPRPPKRPR